MMFDTHCTNCGASNQSPPHYRGKEIRCKSCLDEFIALEDEERTFKFHCPECAGGIDARMDALGIHANCPHCDESILVAQDDEVEASPIPKPEVLEDAITEVQATTKKRRCPYCAEVILADAVVCRFCRTDLRSGHSLDTRPEAVNRGQGYHGQEVQARSSVTDGVKLGCGMFIVLPLLIALAFFLLIIFSAIF